MYTESEINDLYEQRARLCDEIDECERELDDLEYKLELVENRIESIEYFEEEFE